MYCSYLTKSIDHITSRSMHNDNSGKESRAYIYLLTWWHIVEEYFASNGENNIGTCRKQIMLILDYERGLIIIYECGLCKYGEYN